ncbi:MAG: glutamyl-tRNA reductase [Lachnospiraceae bacterium]|jgi:glutamyl-tRNA reductase|nr:glutamyl-tRNA reductase [Lachnospiraceae bacterium]
MECISISHKTAASGERQKFYIPGETAGDFLKKVRAAAGVEQCVLLSTCNRTEIYVQGEENRFPGLEETLADFSGSESEQIRNLARRYQGRKALRHLFRVVCGMESMVLGEDEILGQTRDAYMSAKEAGNTGFELNSAFQAALACAKRVKTETMISKTAVSVATLAASEVARLPLSHKTVLLMGSSGQMGSIILKNLLSQKNVRIIATVRSHNGICLSGGGQVTHVDYQERYAALEEADAVISATASPHYTLTAGRVQKAIRSWKERLFLDISMPPDLDVQIGKLAHCRLVALDDVKGLARENNRRKQQAFADAEEILEEELEKLCKTLAFHRFTEVDAQWKERYAGCSGEKLLYLLRDGLDSGSFERVLQTLTDAVI